MIHCVNPEYISICINRFGDYDFFINPPKYGKNNPFLRCKALDGTMIGIADVKNFKDIKSRHEIFDLMADCAVETFIGTHNTFNNIMRVEEPKHHTIIAAIPYSGVVSKVEFSKVTQLSHIKSYRIHDKSVNEGKDRKILVMILRCDVDESMANYTHSFRLAFFETEKEKKDGSGMIDRERHYIDVFDANSLVGDAWAKINVNYTHANETPGYIATPNGRHHPSMVDFTKFTITPHRVEVQI